MVDELEVLLEADGFEFDATEAHIQCMPHTVHLSALEVWHLRVLSFIYQFILVQLLECIGPIKTTWNKKKGSDMAGSYQDSITAPLSHDYDDDAVRQEDMDEDLLDDPEAVLQEALSTVEKVGN